MSASTRILLVTPHDVEIDPPSDRIVVRQHDATNWTDAVAELPAFTHLAVGPVSGLVRSEDLFREADCRRNEEAVLLPLSGYEWIRELRGSHMLLNVLTRFTNGALVIAPAKLVSIPESPGWLSVAGYRPEGSLLEFLPFDTPLGIAVTERPVAAAGQAFELPRLVPGHDAAYADSGPAIQPRFEQMTEHFGRNGTAVLAGCFQLEDMLDASHSLAQSIEGHPDGDYWHAIMHRREPDYGNSKYWFRHVGRHPVFAQLAPRAAEIFNDAPADIRSHWAPKLKADSSWDPFVFVDMCAAGAADEDGDMGMTARRIQWIEMLLLLKHSARRSGSA